MTIPSSFFIEGKSDKYDFRSTVTSRAAGYAVRQVLEVLRGYTSNPSVSFCFPYLSHYFLSEAAQDWVDQHPGISGPCNNANICPVCARRHEASLRKQFAGDFESLLATGFTPYWQTFELGFPTDMPSIERYGALHLAWRKCLETPRLKAIRSHLQVQYLRVLEETIIDEKWTPHFHVIYLFKQSTTESQIEDFLAEFSLVWRKIQFKARPLIASSHPLYSAKLDGSIIPITSYLFKNFRFEMNGFSILIPKVPSKPFDFLIHFVLTGELVSLERWLEYESVSSGKRRYCFSRNWCQVS